MNRSRPRRLLCCGAFLPEILLLFLLGDTPDLLPTVGGALPSLLIPAAVSVALTGIGVVPAMGFGVLCGLLMDFSRGGPYGFSAMILAALCYSIAALVETVFQKNHLTALLLTVPSIALFFLLHWLFFYIFAGFGGGGYALLCRYLPMAGYTLAAAVPIYCCTYGLAKLCRIP